MFWMRNKENSFPICTLIWRPVKDFKTFSYFVHRQDEKRIHVNRNHERRLQCSTCGKSYMNLSHFKRHLKSSSHQKIQAHSFSTASDNTISTGAGISNTEAHTLLSSPNVTKDETEKFKKTGKFKKTNPGEASREESSVKSLPVSLKKAKAGIKKQKYKKPKSCKTTIKANGNGTSNVKVNTGLSAKDKLKKIKQVKQIRKRSYVPKTSYCIVCEKTYAKIKSHFTTEKHKAAIRARRLEKIQQKLKSLETGKNGLTSGPEVIKPFFMLNSYSTEQEISTAHKKIPTSEEVIAISLSDVVFILIINVKMPTIIGILTFMNRINIMLS